MGLFDSGGDTTSTFELPGFQKGPTKQIFGEVAGLQNNQFFPGQTFAGQDPTTQLGQQSLFGAAQNFFPGQLDIAQNFLGQNAGTSLSQGAQDVIGFGTDEILRSLQGTRNDIGLGATGVGQFGGSRQGVLEANALRGAQGQIGNFASQVGLQDLGQQRNAFLGAFGATNQLGTAQGDLLTQLGLGNEFRNQQQINEDMARFNFEQLADENRLAFQHGLIVPAGNQVGGTTTSSVSQPGLGSQILGAATSLGGATLGAAGAAGGFGALFTCWVAREVYGAANPKWLEMRHWMLTEASDELRDFYIANGPQIAEYISDKPERKAEFKGYMDRILEAN